MAAFAKLSGSLLENNQRVPAADGAAGSTEVARLYDELRDCIAANDQEGVQRIFGELVRAQRPISEISEIVEGLSRPEARQRPEAEHSPVPEEPPLPSNVLAFEQGRPDLPAHEPGEEHDTGTIEPANLPTVDGASAAAAEESAFNRPDDEQSEQAEGDVLPEENPNIGVTVTAPLEAQNAWPPLEDEPEPRRDPYGAEVYAGNRLAAMRETLQYAASPAAETGTSNYGLASRRVVAADARPAFLSPRAFIYAALVAVAIIVAAGAFFLMRPTGKEAAAVAANGPANVSAASTPGASSARSKSATAEKPAQLAATPPIPASPLPSSASTAPTAAGAEQPAKVNPIAAPSTPEPAPSSPPAMAVAVAPTAATDQPATKPAPPNEPADKKAAASSPAESTVATAPPPRTSTDAASASADRPETEPALASLGRPNNAVPIGRPTPAPADPVAAPPSAAKPDTETAKAAASPDTAPLLDRGDRLFAVGDIASARLFYQRAAEAGDARAALRLGESYDPAFLERARLRVQGDRTLAIFWYGRARDLGASEAEILLKAMQSR
jgi:hypothetical protein